LVHNSQDGAGLGISLDGGFLGRLLLRLLGWVDGQRIVTRGICRIRDGEVGSGPFFAACGFVEFGNEA
jgi:hypothetical protein